MKPDTNTFRENLRINLRKSARNRILHAVGLFLMCLNILSISFAQNNPGKEFPIRYTLPWELHPVNPNSTPFPDFSHVTSGAQFFMNDARFNNSSITQFNQTGSFGYFRNGIETAVKTGGYRFLADYSYTNWNGYRQHNNSWGHILNLYLESKISSRSRLRIFGSYIDGMIRMPGSLTLEEYNKDRFAADPRSVNRDEKRISHKGRLDISWDTRFGKKLNNEFFITGTGRIESFIRTTEEYKIINKTGLGLVAGYTNKTRIMLWENQFSAGLELFTEGVKTEFYENFAGEQSDLLEQIHREKIGNSAFYLTDKFGDLSDHLSILLSGRFDRENYTIAEQVVPSRSDTKRFQAFTPLVKLQYREESWLSLWASFSSVFRAPTEKELESPVPEFLYNQDLSAQTTNRIEIGIAGALSGDTTRFLNKLHYEITANKEFITNLIVPYEVFLEEFFRNASKAERATLATILRLSVFKGLNLSAGYTWSYYKYQSYVSDVFEQDSTGNIVQRNRDFSGKLVPGIPQNTISGIISYEHTFARRFSIFARMNYSAMSGLWVDDGNSARTDFSQTVNLMAGAEYKISHLDVLLSGGANNMLNENYVGWVTVNSADKRFYNTGAPRNYFCSLNLKYIF
jgi:outer membrane receptor protein involved in Fe transport